MNNYGKFYSHSNFIKTYYLIEEVATGFQVTKTIITKTGKVKVKIYKTIHATRLAAECFFTRCMKVSAKLSAMWAKAREIAIEAKVNLCASLLGQAKMKLAEKVAESIKEQYDFYNSKLGRFTND